MSSRTVLALCLIAFPLAAAADGLGTPGATAVPTPPPAPTPDLIVTLGAGAGVEPTYFGSNSYGAVPAFAFRPDFLRLGATRSIGSTDPGFIATGLAPRFSFRSVKERSAADSPELTGLTDIDPSVEVGMGLIYRQPEFEVYADARYGVVGHNAWVGELGADWMMPPIDGLELALGPRLFVGDGDYAATYFGVTPAEAAASGLTAFAPSGALSAGMEFGATYALNDSWGLQGTVRYDRLLGDAAGSPITGLGSENQFSASLILTRRIVLDF